MTGKLFGVLVTVALFARCTFDASLPPDVLIACGDSGICPNGFTCNADSGLCVPDGAMALASAPELSLPAGQTAIKNGDRLIVSGSATAGVSVASAQLVEVGSDTVVMSTFVGWTFGMLV